MYTGIAVRADGKVFSHENYPDYCVTSPEGLDDDGDLHPLEDSLPRPSTWSTSYRGPNPRRGKDHHQSTGWKRHADLYYRSA